MYLSADRVDLLVMYITVVLIPLSNSSVPINLIWHKTESLMLSIYAIIYSNLSKILSHPSPSINGRIDHHIPFMTSTLMVAEHIPNYDQGSPLPKLEDVEDRRLSQLTGIHHHPILSAYDCCAPTPHCPIHHRPCVGTLRIFHWPKLLLHATRIVGEPWRASGEDQMQK